MIIKIVDTVVDTHSNVSGLTLFDVLEEALDDNQIIHLSFENASCPSSSFLNSSIGALIEKYGIGVLQKIKPSKVTKTQGDLLKIFIASVSKTI